MINAGIEFFRPVDLFRSTSSRRPLPVDLLRFTNAGQRKIGKIAPKSSKSPLTWVGRRNEVDRNPRYLYATRTVHVKGFARPPGYIRPPNGQAAGSSPREPSISLGPCATRRLHTTHQTSFGVDFSKRANGTVLKTISGCWPRPSRETRWIYTHKMSLKPNSPIFPIPGRIYYDRDRE